MEILGILAPLAAALFRLGAPRGLGGPREMLLDAVAPATRSRSREAS